MKTLSCTNCNPPPLITTILGFVGPTKTALLELDDFWNPPVDPVNPWAHCEIPEQQESGLEKRE